MPVGTSSMDRVSATLTSLCIRIRRLQNPPRLSCALRFSISLTIRSSPASETTSIPPFWGEPPPRWIRQLDDARIQRGGGSHQYHLFGESHRRAGSAHHPTGGEVLLLAG